jgi:hypothetical protein
MEHLVQLIVWLTRSIGLPHTMQSLLTHAPSFSLMMQMGLLAANTAIIAVEPHCLKTVGLLSVISKINEIREGRGYPNLRVAGILVTKMDSRVRRHSQLLNDRKNHPPLGKLLLAFITIIVTVSYDSQASQAYAQVVGRIVKSMGGAFTEKRHETNSKSTKTGIVHASSRRIRVLVRRTLNSLSPDEPKPSPSPRSV